MADDWQGRGVGTALARALLRRRPVAVRRLSTEVEADNRASLALLSGAGRMSSSVPVRGVVGVTVELALPRPSDPLGGVARHELQFRRNQAAIMDFGLDTTAFMAARSSACRGVGTCTQPWRRRPATVTRTSGSKAFCGMPS